MSSDILACRLLKTANLADTQEQLIRTTVKELTYDAMQLQLKKIFGEKNSDLEKQVVLMSKWNLIHSIEKLMMLLKMCITKGINFRTEDTTTTTRSNRGRRGGRSYGTGVSKRHKNPIDSHGNISRYRICESINHWEDNCPDNPYGKSKGNTGVVLY